LEGYVVSNLKVSQFHMWMGLMGGHTKVCVKSLVRCGLVHHDGTVLQCNLRNNQSHRAVHKCVTPHLL
jgi:hypothetical protein